MLKDLPRPAIFAHRGASAYAPENTLAAFHLALEQGADGIEMDVSLCADEQVVVIHDNTVDRTTEGSGQVDQMSLQALRELDAGAFFDRAFQGERIPLFDEALELIGKRAFVVVELKYQGASSVRLVEKAVKAIQAHAMEENILISSFHPMMLRQVRRFNPRLPVAQLALHSSAGAILRSPIGRLIINYQALHPDHRDVNPSLVKRVHGYHCRLHAYTVDRAEDMLALFRLGIDGIFTNDPILALKTRQDFFQEKIEQNVPI